MKTSPFEEAFNANTVKRRRDQRGREFKQCVAIHLNRKGESLFRLLYIETLQPRRRCGHASAAMHFLCDLADDYGIQLELCPCALDEKGLNLVQLTLWYQTFGFKRIGLNDEMVRYPKRGWTERAKAHGAM